MKKRIGTFFVVIIVFFIAMVGMHFLKTISVAATEDSSDKMDFKVSAADKACVKCHSKESPAIIADWSNSKHAPASVGCVDCHGAKSSDKDISTKHLKHDKTKVSAIVSPKDCSSCHAKEVREYGRSKHAVTLELIWKIDPWLNHGMNNDIERATGCLTCHGTIVKMSGGTIDPMTWPNVGVGRLNPDGSKGSCSSCHTRHLYSIEEARKPESCAQCHLGPDHPQIEIYKESKHGAIYDTEGDKWNWTKPSGKWEAGTDYRTPTCSVCHMSKVGSVPLTHDVTERLAWETQAPLTVRPENFKPWPAKTDWKKEREKMKKVCLECHSQSWTDGHFVRFDKAVINYNEVYYKPMKKRIDELYAKKLLSKEKNLDEKLEIDMYELWHHEGRRARFGAAMMAPDYAWWHGFYDLKKRVMDMDVEIDKVLKENKPVKRFDDIMGTGGDRTKPNFK